MISVLSREADRSMLGLVEGEKSVFHSLRRGLSGRVLLHGGGQAGDPAILQGNNSQSSSIPSSSSVPGGTYVALEGTLENQLLGHCRGLGSSLVWEKRA